MANKIDEPNIATGAELESEARLRAILDSSPIGVGISDIESGTIKYVNDRNLEIMGVNRDDFLGGSAKSFWANLADRNEFVKAFHRDGQVSQEVQQRKADGTLIWCVLTWERSPVAANEVIFWVHDVTELKRARDEAKHFQDELIRHRNHLAEMVEERTNELVTVTDNLPALITRLDAERRYIFANRAAEQWFARKSDQILGRTVKEILGDDAYERLAPLLDKALAGEPQSFEQRLTYPEGVTRDVEISYLPDVDPHGTVSGLFSLVTDISERKKVESELKQSTDLLIQAEEIAKIGHWKWDDNGQKMLFCSEQAAAIFGRSQGELLARSATHTGYLDLIFEADRQDVDLAISAFYREFRKNPAKAPPLDLEYRIVWPDGKIRFVQEQAESITNDQGIIARSVGTIRDITDRKRAEEALRQSESNYRNILNNMQETFYRTDLDGSIVMVSLSAENLLGYRIDELIGEKLASLYMHPDDRAAFLNELESSGGNVVAYEAPLRHKLGHEVWVSTNAQYHLDDEGNVLGIEGTARDVSDRKAIEREIIHAKEFAEAANSAKSQFLANMSHELRTPLNAILGFSEIMQKESLGPLGSEKYKEYADDIHNSGALLLDLITDVLDLSRIEAGAMDLAEDAVELNQVVDTAVRMITERAARKSIHIDTNFDPSSPVILGDERAIKQIVLNLLSNCTKFTDEGGTITVSSEIENDGEVLLTVADNGIGIAAADIPKVMEPFGQISNTRTRKHEGTGLGLPFSKKLTELHDAAFELESRTGVGTTVRLRFPPERHIGANDT